MNEQRSSKSVVLPLLFLLSVAGPQGLTLRLEAGQQEKELSLEKLLNTQITTAAKYKQSLNDAPASLTIITSEDIEQYGYRTLSDVLQSVPGFYLSNDRNYDYLGTRGFGRPADYNDRVLLMLNGHTLNEGVYGSAMIGTEFGLDLNIVDRVEIIRGPGSALYGTSALFAVINVITKPGADLAGGRVSVEAGSYGLRKGAAVIGHKSARGLEFTLAGQWADADGPDLYFREFDAPETNFGRAAGQDWDKSRGLYAALAYQDFSFQGSFTSRIKGVPTASYGTLFNDGHERTRDNLGFLEFKFERNLGSNKSLMVRGYYNLYDYAASYPYEDLLNLETTTDSWLGGEARLRWDFAPSNRLILGLEYQNHLRVNYGNYSADAVFLDFDWPFSLVSVFAQDEFQIASNFALTLGVRYDSYSNAKRRASPRFAAVYHPFASSTVKFLYGEAFRVPGPYEMSIEDPLSGYKPNFDLKPEVIRTFELSWDQKLGKRFYASVSLFRYRMIRLIDWVLDPADDLLQSRNVGTIYASGVEFGLNAQLGRSVRFFGSYSWQNAHDSETAGSLTNSPAHLLKGGLAVSVAGALTASLHGIYESSRLTVEGTRSDPFVLMDLNLVSRPLFRHVVLSLRVHNLFDASYGYPGGFEHLQPVIIQDGRTFMVRAEYRF